MTPCRVVFSPEALQHLTQLFRYIAEAASPTIAAGYTEAIVADCERLATFPQRGTPRDDIRPGLRLTHYKKRTVIAYAVNATEVAIIGIFYGGQDHHSLLQDTIQPDSRDH